VRVLWLVRRNLTEFPGGDTIQVLDTQQALENMGVVVDRRSVDQLPTKEDADRYDLVHLFHLDRLWENIPAAKAAMKVGLPYTLSTIYWPTCKFDGAARTGINGGIARVFGGHAFQSFRQAERWCVSKIKERVPTPLDPMCLQFDNAARFLLSNASVCLPNSKIEWDRLQSRFESNARMVAVPNAVRDEFLTQDESESAPARSGVISVGRIEPRKNQLALIRAVSEEFGPPIDLTVVGSPGRFSSRYYRRCRASAGPHVRFLTHQSVDSLKSIYKGAKVHVSPSWYDTPGLVNLEAGVLGCSLVVGSDGSAYEYFGDWAQYTDPSDPASIRAAIEHALDSQPSAEGPSSLEEIIKEKFTWVRAGEETFKAYQQSLCMASS